MAELKTVQINSGASLHFFTDPSFKTMRVSIHMLVPLTPENAAIGGILPSLVTRASREFPDYTALSQKLSMLYGASVEPSVTKLGGYQVISVTANGISSRYAFGGEDMLAELSGMLLSMMFQPLLDEEGLFPKDGFEQEKRQTLEIFDSEFNDKIYYAARRASEILFGDAPQGIDRHGRREDVAGLDRSTVTHAWDMLLRQARFEIFVSGDCRPEPEGFQKAFQAYGRDWKKIAWTPAGGPLKDVTEEMQLSQSKLVLGFYADMKPRERLAFILMSAVFGGTPSAKLFMNVREKMGLCYYCSSSFEPNNSVMFVQSGIETENIEKTRMAILEQLEEMKQGNITEDEILSAKLAICNAYRSVPDSLDRIESWYLSRTFEETALEPEAAAKQMMAVTKAEIVKAANALTLDTVYTLKGTL